MEKHAFLVIAHHNFGILKRLLRLLDHPSHDIFIHIDRKVKHFDFAAFGGICKESRIYFTDRRIDVRWGHKSQVLCEMLLFETAYKKDTYAWFHLISGVDLPLCGMSEFDEFFAGKQKSFLNLAKETTRLDRERIAFYRVQNERLDRLCVWVQRRLGVCRTKQMTVKKGANWASLYRDSVRVLLEKKALIRKMTLASVCADEVYKQTILWNFARETIYFDQNGNTNNFRYTDWSAGGNSPKTLDETDYEKIVRSGQLFARKFDETLSEKLIQKLM